VKSEELEVSLRTDFESYLSGILAEMQQQVADFQTRVDTELEKHRSQLGEAFQDFSSRLKTDRTLDPGFRESILEHLRLARDSGAQLTAEAFVEAEAMRRKETADLGFADIRDAINEISSQTTQSSILKSLVTHAERFAARGAFFIVRNEQFVGWQAFGRDAGTADNVVRSVSLPVSAKTILGEACRSLGPVLRRPDAASEDALFLDKLGYSGPAVMTALPLVVRGRGVAVLYADTTPGGDSFNCEALETLLRVASLTVELLASNQAALPQTNAPSTGPRATSTPPASLATETKIEASHTGATETAAQQKQSVSYEQTEVAEEHHAEASIVSSLDPAFGANDPDMMSEAYEVSPDVVTYIAETEASSHRGTETEQAAAAEPELERFEAYHVEAEETVAVETGRYADADVEVKRPEFALESSSGAIFTREPQTAAQMPETVSVKNGSSSDVTVDRSPVAASSAAFGTTMRVGGRGRSMDLPIEVSEAERPEHVKARRFARLLVSEINLYNEQKVKEGRTSGDLYDRLRDAIDRSREMYDQRVQKPVASRFDYFHYELVNSLAEGDQSRLGANYPGAKV